MGPDELPASLTWERTRRDWRDTGWGRHRDVLRRPGWSDPGACLDPDDPDVLACDWFQHYCLTHDQSWYRCGRGEGTFHELAPKCPEHGMISRTPADCQRVDSSDGFDPPLSAAQLTFWGWSGGDAHRLAPALRLGYEPPARAQLRRVIGDVEPPRVLRYPDRVDYRPGSGRWWPTPALLLPAGAQHEALAYSLAGLGLGAVLGDLPPDEVADLDWVDGLRLGVLHEHQRVAVRGGGDVVIDTTGAATADSALVTALLAAPSPGECDPTVTEDATRSGSIRPTGGGNGDARDPARDSDRCAPGEIRPLTTDPRA